MDSLKGRVIINESKSKKKNFNNNNNNKYSNMNNNNNSTTTKKKKKFLLCFKPMTMDGLEEDPVFKYFAVEEKEGMFFPVLSKPSMAPDKKEAQEEEEKGGGRRKKGRNVKLSKFLKAVFTGTFLAKKLKKGKLGESSFRSETIIAEKGVKTMNSMNKDSLKQDDDNLRINSNISSCSRRSSAFTATTMCSSFSSSSSTSNSRSMSQRCNSFESTLTGSNGQNEQRQDKNNNVQKHEKWSRGFYVGFCLPLICLLVLIFWGKIFAILCTSMGFFMVRWSSRCALPEDGIKSSEFDSDKHKKKVIMEGRLKRDRAHEL